jgi:hypothetical protein
MTTEACTTILTADAGTRPSCARSLERVATTALVLGGASEADQALSRTLAQLRPWALMLVVASSEASIADMLRALRA